jgi:hypothetical protein
MLAPGWGTGTRGGSPPGVKPVSVLVTVKTIETYTCNMLLKKAEIIGTYTCNIHV